MWGWLGSKIQIGRYFISKFIYVRRKHTSSWFNPFSFEQHARKPISNGTHLLLFQEFRVLSCYFIVKLICKAGVSRRYSRLFTGMQEENTGTSLSKEHSKLARKKLKFIHSRLSH